MKRSIVRLLFMVLLIFGFSGTIAAQLEAMVNPAGEGNISAEERDIEPYRSVAPKRVHARRSELALHPCVGARPDAYRDFFARIPQHPQPTATASPPSFQILRI